MSRKVEFRDNHHVALLGIGDEFLHFLLRVVAPIAFRAGQIGRRNQFVLASPSPLAREFGIFLDFDAPSVVVGEVQMEPVELMMGHPVDVAPQIVQFEERARHIEHEAPIAETGSIFHGECIHRVFLQAKVFTGIDFGREKLEEGLYTVVSACIIGRGDGDALLLDFQSVTFFGKTIVGHECNGRSIGSPTSEGNGEIENLFQLVLKITGGEVVRLRRDDGQPFLYQERPLSHLYFLGSREDVRLIVTPSGENVSKHQC